MSQRRVGAAPRVGCGDSDHAHRGSLDVGQRLIWVIGAVVAMSFVLLMAVFRSVAVPIKAAVMNLLSIGAAYGVIVAIFQWGWLRNVVGIGRPGPIPTSPSSPHPGSAKPATRPS